MTTMPRRSRRLPKYFVSVVVLLAVGTTVLFSLKSRKKATNPSKYAAIIEGVVKKTSSPSQEGWKRPDDVIYGLVHVAKTGGTSINGELAAHFERVCGNKGYSYDSYQTNLKLAEIPDDKKTQRMKANIVGDSVSQLYPNKNNRGKPPSAFAKEIGFEDCDYIAEEYGHTDAWINLADYFWNSHKIRMELHLPCREPVEHLLSKCNYKERDFDCELAKRDMTAAIHKCNTNEHRLDDPLVQASQWNTINGNASVSATDHSTKKKFNLYCFNPMPPSRYVNGYMGSILQRKRIDVNYTKRNTNRKRRRDKECVWNESQEFQEQLRHSMHQYNEYYRFCHACMGSSEELQFE